VRTASATTPASKNPNQFKALLAMSRAIEAEDAKNLPEALAQYRSAIVLNPDFDRAKARLASIERATQ
jgi:hypothetical protein